VLPLLKGLTTLNFLPALQRARLICISERIILCYPHEYISTDGYPYSIYYRLSSCHAIQTYTHSDRGKHERYESNPSATGTPYAAAGTWRGSSTAVATIGVAGGSTGAVAG
jgi:hypothetical protein